MATNYPNPHQTREVTDAPSKLTWVQWNFPPAFVADATATGQASIDIAAMWGLKSSLNLLKCLINLFFLKQINKVHCCFPLYKRNKTNHKYLRIFI